MPSYLSNRKRQKLYKEWVENSGLSAEDIPEADLTEDDSSQVQSEESFVRKSAHAQGILSVRITLRHIFYLVLIVVILVITTATLSTVLIMRSC